MQVLDFYFITLFNVKLLLPVCMIILDKFIQSHGGYQVFNNASIIYHKNLIDKKANSSINQDLHEHKIAEPIILKHSFKRKPKLQAPVKPKDDANVTHNEPKETLQSPQIKPNRNLPIIAPQTVTFVLVLFCFCNKLIITFKSLKHSQNTCHQLRPHQQ